MFSVLGVARFDNWRREKKQYFCLTQNIHLAQLRITNLLIHNS